MTPEELLQRKCAALSLAQAMISFSTALTLDPGIRIYGLLITVCAEAKVQGIKPDELIGAMQEMVNYMKEEQPNVH